jgi:hypothetical protein
MKKYRDICHIYLNSGVVRDNHAFSAVDSTDSSQDASTWNVFVAVQVICSELRELQEWRSWIDESLDSLSWEEFSPRLVELGVLRINKR